MSKKMILSIVLIELLFFSALIESRQIFFLILLIFSQLTLIAPLVGAGARATHYVSEPARRSRYAIALSLLATTLIFGAYTLFIFKSQFSFDAQKVLALAIDNNGEPMMVFTVISLAFAALFALAVMKKTRKGGN